MNAEGSWDTYTSGFDGILSSPFLQDERRDLDWALPMMRGKQEERMKKKGVVLYSPPVSLIYQV